MAVEFSSDTAARQLRWLPVTLRPGSMLWDTHTGRLCFVLEWISVPEGLISPTAMKVQSGSVAVPGP